MFLVYTLNQAAEWDKVVRSFVDYDVYYLSGYVKAFWFHGDGEPLLLYFTHGDTKGINVVMKRDIAKNSSFKDKFLEGLLFDLSTPYGYGGWLIEGENTDILFEEYEKWCQENKIVSEFVRFHPVLKNHVIANKIYEVVPMGETVTMDLSSPDIIWNNMTSKNRNMIRKAQKNGIRIYNGRNPELYKIFRNIYNSTMDRDHAKKYYYFEESFYDSILEDISQNAQVFYAVLNGNTIASSIILAVNGRMNYHLSGSVREYAHFAPTNLLLYKAALWGCLNGYRTLYLGGGVSNNEDSLFKFKKAFYRGDVKNRFYIGKKIMNADLYKELVDMRGHSPDNGYFPMYRA